MKSLREWVEENNLNEIFGFDKPNPKAQAPAFAKQLIKEKSLGEGAARLGGALLGAAAADFGGRRSGSYTPKSQNGGGSSWNPMRFIPGTNAYKDAQSRSGGGSEQNPAVAAPKPQQQKAFCPFCNEMSAVEEDAYYPKGLMVWHCQKCKRDWDPEAVAKRNAEMDRPGTLLHKDDVMVRPAYKECLYLSGLISEEAYYEADMQPQQGAANLAGKSELGQNAPVGQQELSKLYPKGKVMNFIKNIPVALAPFKNLEQMFGAEKASEIAGMAGEVDKVPSYDQAYQQNGYVVFQYDSKGNKPDVYIADPGSVSKNYTKFEGQLPTDPKSRGKIPSLVVLDKLGLDANKVPFFVKKVPTEMISADEVGLANKVIQTSWGEQTVQSGGFLVREPNGHIYTVAPDASGLPIGYIKA